MACAAKAVFAYGDDNDLKFDECYSCVHRGTEQCDYCESGEYFEEEEPEGVDALFRKNDGGYNG